VIPDAAASGRWYEPSRAHTSPSGYAPRYAIGLMLLGLAALAVLWYLADRMGGLPSLPAATIAASLVSVGFVVLPGSVLRRLFAAALGFVGVFAYMSLGFWDTPLMWLNTLMWSYDSRNGEFVAAICLVAAWLVVRDRPGLSYLTLLIPVAILGIYSLAVKNQLFPTNIYWAFVSTMGDVDQQDGASIAVGVSVTIAIGWLLLVGVPVLVARLIAPARARAAQRSRQFGAAQPLATHTAGTSRTWQVSPPVPHTNTLAILALVFGILGGVLGIVFGHIARGQIRRTGEGGWGMATAGLVLGYISTALAVVFWILYVAFFANLYSSIGMY